EAQRSLYNDLQYPQAVVTLKPIDWNFPMEALQANEALLSDYPKQTTLQRWSQAEQVEVISKLASYQDLQGLDIHALQSEKTVLEQAISQLLTEKNTVEEKLQTLLQAISKVQGNIQTLSQEVEDRKQQHTIMQSDLDAALTREQITIEEVVGMKITQQALESEKNRITMYENQVVIQNNLLADSIQSYNDFLTQHPDALSWDKAELTAQVATITFLLQQQQKQLETLKDMGKTLTQTLNEIEAQNVELATLEVQFTQINELALLVDNKKMGFKSYVLSVYFDEILEAANMRFKKMTDHRYTMRRDAINARENANSALNLVVHDAYNEKDRDIKTLSGGESFKAALALALAMGDVVRGNAGGINIDTIFIDEGFGTLDPDSLDSALEVLLDLKESGRMVGVISHVPELKNRISNKIEILKSNVGSRIELHT
ncbi:MAG: SbcC/MukB-like Walker B domain-containing protein, partial [Erysipelotrichaceae bacterium]